MGMTAGGRGSARGAVCGEDHSRPNHDDGYDYDYDYGDGGDCNFGKNYGQREKARALDRNRLGSHGTFFDKITPKRSSCTTKLTIRFLYLFLPLKRQHKKEKEKSEIKIKVKFQ
jgi:hypothetical protein